MPTITRKTEEPRDLPAYEYKLITLLRKETKISELIKKFGHENEERMQFSNMLISIGLDKKLPINCSLTLCIFDCSLRKPFLIE